MDPMIYSDRERELGRPLSHGRSEHFGDGELADRLLSLFDLAKIDGPAPPAREWIVPDYVPANEVTLFTGPGGAGKSLLSQQIATALSTGGRCLGMDLEPAPVLFVTAEDGEDELHRRQCALGPLDPAKLFLASLRGVLATELATFDRDGEISLTPLFEMIRATLDHTGATVLILDNLAHLFGGNENDRGQVTRFVNALYALRRELGRDLTILLIGHPNKSGDAYSGSTAWLNAVRSQIEIARTEDEHDLDGRVLRVGKANYARFGTETRFRWHDGAFVLDSELSQETRQQLDEAIRVSGENEAFLRCLRTRDEQGRGDVG
ncbi:AAA family ATPase, partial [Citromicrobium bathyomarinum]|uniref:AAA family ATPase n=1 Tax=Citromicrobium bathyomarinum TaxID=72174 RepID=UPI00315A41B0